MFHSYCFDFSVWEMYGALLYGGKLVIIPLLTAKDPGLFIEILIKEKVTVLPFSIFFGHFLISQYTYIFLNSIFVKRPGFFSWQNLKIAR